MKYLYVNGCSFTWGGGFESEFPDGFDLGTGQESGWMESSQPHGDEFENFRLNNTWPIFTANKLDLEIIGNRSMGGGSNSRTIRTTIDSFEGFIKDGIHEEVLAIIQLTESTRFDLYSNFSDERILAKVDCWNWSPKNEKEKNALKEFFECFVDEDVCDNHMIEQIILLQTFFKFHGINYKFIWGFGFPNNVNKFVRGWGTPQNQKQLEMVDFNNFIFNGKDSMINYMWDNYQKDCYEGRHLRPSGHKLFGDFLGEKLSDESNFLF